MDTVVGACSVNARLNYELTHGVYRGELPFLYISVAP